ncbi:sensor histidine kinase [Flectobacillus major]|uniref:sensor histidine kinase n=1 Tax=Flectobacillus major TaxID=103 RepID=UPI000410070C|nr:histidine kinase [Flectobacillus major]
MMDSIEKFRRYELFFILLAIVVYVIRRLILLANEFDFDISTAEKLNIPNHVIWKDLADYDHNFNTIFPTIAAAVLFTLAWYIFHFWVFPRIQNKKYNSPTIVTIVACTLLVMSSLFVYHYFKLYCTFRYNFNGQIIGFKVYSIFRKLYLLTNTIAGVAIILFYEAVAQTYYYTTKLSFEKKEEKYQLLSGSILGVSILIIIFWMFFGTIANAVVGTMGIPLGLTMLAITIGVHYVFYKKVIPYYAALDYNKRESTVQAFLGFCAYILFSIFCFSIWDRFFPYNRLYFKWVYIVPNIVGIFLAVGRWYFFTENITLQTQVFQQSAELSSLRSQINPHFLFNALNTLYAVALKENAEMTSNGIQKLGDMMRFMLHENHQERIPLTKEIEYLENFIEIQRMRIDEAHNIDIRINLQQLNQAIYLAPMLLNPFVENAFKHGISFRNPSWIYITLTFDATTLYFKVHNSAHPKSEHDTEKKSGVGLENVQKRLALIYPNRHELSIQQSEQDFFVSLIIRFY